MAHACKRMNNFVGLVPIQPSSNFSLQSIAVERAVFYCFRILPTTNRSSQLIYQIANQKVHVAPHFLFGVPISGQRVRLTQIPCMLGFACILQNAARLLFDRPTE